MVVVVFSCSRRAPVSVRVEVPECSPSKTLDREGCGLLSTGLNNLIDQNIMPVSKKRRHKNNKANVAPSLGQQLFLKARNEIRSKGNISYGLARYKRRASLIELSQVFPYFLDDEAYRILIWPTTFPRTYSQLGKGGLPRFGALNNELAWNTQALLYFAPQINEFLEVKKRCENAFLNGATSEIESVLKECEERFGVSLWLVETTMNYFQTYRSHQHRRTYANEIVANNKMHPICAFLVSWMSFRCEEHISSTEFYRHLTEVMPASGPLSSLAHALLGACPKLNEQSGGAAIAYVDM